VRHAWFLLLLIICLRKGNITWLWWSRS
jgi:hypothetical protein